MHPKYLLALALLSTLAAAGCDHKTDPRLQSAPDKESADVAQKEQPDLAKGTPWPQTVFEGITVPGTAAQAKAAGFNDCRIVTLDFGAKVMECQTDDANVAGVPALSATVQLDAGNNLNDTFFGIPETQRSTEGKKLEDLTYGSVAFKFQDRVTSLRCGQKPRPADCKSWEVRERIKANLAKAGWVELPFDAQAGVAPIVHRDIPLTLTFLWTPEDFTNGTWTLRVAPTDLQASREGIAKVEATRAADQRKADAEKRLVEEMKSAEQRRTADEQRLLEGMKSAP